MFFTYQEAAYINKSLSFLEQTVMALSDPSREHVPYRHSKLTHYLKDAIGGNSVTTLIANIWGEASQIEETVSSITIRSLSFYTSWKMLCDSKFKSYRRKRMF